MCGKCVYMNVPNVTGNHLIRHRRKDHIRPMHLIVLNLTVFFYRQGHCSSHFTTNQVSRQHWFHAMQLLSIDGNQLPSRLNSCIMGSALFKYCKDVKISLLVLANDDSHTTEGRRGLLHKAFINIASEIKGVRVSKR